MARPKGSTNKKKTSSSKPAFRKPEEPSAIAVYEGEYAALNRKPEEIRAIITSNVGNEGLTMSDLDRIKVPSGAAPIWMVETLKGDEMLEQIEGVIVAHRQARVYWQESYEDAGGGNPPDCASQNGEFGIGEPGGDCEKCPLNKWGSSEKSERGKACKEIRMVFMLRPTSLIPILFTFPPTSIVPIRKYFLQLAGEGLPAYGVTTILRLGGAQNKDGIKYSKVKPTLGRVLNDSELERVQAYVAAIGPAINASRVEIEQEELES